MAIGILLLMGLFLWQQIEARSAQQELIKTISEQHAASQAAMAKTVSATGEVTRSLAELSTAMAATSKGISSLSEAMTRPRPIEAEPVGDAMRAAIMLSRLTNEQCRYHAAEILGCLGGKDAETRLLQMATEERSEQAQSSAFRALATMQSDKLMPLAIRLLKNGTLAQKRAAAGSMSQSAQPKHLPDLIQALEQLKGKDHQVAQIRYSLYQIFRRLGDPRACKVLSRAIEEEQTSSSYKQEALRAFVLSMTNREVPLFLRTVARMEELHSSGYSSSNLTRALGALRDPRLGPFLVQLLSSSSSYTNRYVCEALKLTADPSVAAELCKRHDDPNGKAKKELAVLLKGGYPGVVYDEKTKRFSVVGEDEMKKLMAERDQRIRQIVQGQVDDGQNPGQGQEEEFF